MGEMEGALECDETSRGDRNYIIAVADLTEWRKVADLNVKHSFQNIFIYSRFFMYLIYFA